MTQPGGKLWPLWLFPALCFVGGAELLDRITHSATDIQGDGFGAQLLLFWALFSVPAYGVTIVALRGRLKRLRTRLIALVALLAAVGTPLVFGLCMLVAQNGFIDEHLRPISVVALVMAPVLAPAFGLFAGYALIRRRYADSTGYAG